MINELQVFSYEGSEIRTVQLGGEPWWVLKDICDVLQLSNPSVIADRLDEDEKAKVEPKQYLGSRKLLQPNLRSCREMERQSGAGSDRPGQRRMPDLLGRRN